MIMKNISISISENKKNPNKNYFIDNELFQYITSVVSSEYQYINLVWICDLKYSRIPFLKHALLYQKRITRARGVIIHNTVRIVNGLPDKKLKKFCVKNKITIEIEFDTSADLLQVLSNVEPDYKVDTISIIDTYNVNLIKIYNLAKKYCFKLNFKQFFIYSQGFNEQKTDEYLRGMKELFDYWLKDKNGIFLNPFVDYIHSFYKIAAEKECINSSCLGKTLNIDGDGIIYLCAQFQKKEYEIGNFKNFSSVSEIFQTEAFTSLVKNMIEFRETCIKNCCHFNFCQGGCSACVNTYGMCAAYCEIVKGLDDYISHTIQEIITKNRSLGSFNPVLSNIVKEIISYNPMMLVDKECLPLYHIEKNK